jgi:hypothetical protein
MKEHVRLRISVNGPKETSKHIRQWSDWIAGLTNPVGDFLQGAAGEEDRAELAATYLFYLYAKQGAREEGLTNARTAIRGFFRANFMSTYVCWDSDAVRRMRAAGYRDLGETRERLKEKALTEKYDINFAFMHAVRAFLTPWDDDWTRYGMFRKMVWLSTVWMFDIGMRVGSCVSVGMKRPPVKSARTGGNSTSKSRAETAWALGEADPLASQEDELLKALGAIDAEEGNQVASHTWLHSDIKYIYVTQLDGPRDSMSGGRAWYERLKTLSNEQVVAFDVSFPTGKTATGANALRGPKIHKPARVTREGLAMEMMDLHLEVIRKNGSMAASDPVFKMSKPTAKNDTGRGRGWGEKVIQSSSVTECLKLVAVELGLAPHHFSCKCLRSGALSVAFAMNREERRLDAEALAELTDRGGPNRGWAVGSTVPETHYLVDHKAKGPFSMAASWEGVLGGGVDELRTRMPVPMDHPSREGIRGLPAGKETWRAKEEAPRK